MSQSDAATVFLVDDHPVVRVGYRSLLQRASGFEVVGEAGSGEEALDLILACQPDIAIVDISMKDMDGLELTRRLKQALPNLRVLIVSIHDSLSFVRRGRNAGADGYISKGNADGMLVEGVQQVSSGETFFPNGVA